MAGFVYASHDGRNSVSDDSPDRALSASDRMESHLYNDHDTRAVLHHLLEQNAHKRIEILTGLRNLIKRNRGNIPFNGTSRFAVFEVLSHVLEDVRWEVRHQCLLLIASILPNLGKDMDLCMALMLSKLISNLGHDNSNVCYTSVQILHWYLRNTNNVQQFLKAFVQFGLESGDYLTRKGSIRSVGVLFTEDLAGENLSLLIECLAKLLIDCDTTLFYPVFLAMKKIKDLVGINTFHLYLQRVDNEAAKMYERIEKNSVDDMHSLNNNHVNSSNYVNGKNFNTNSLSRKNVSLLMEFCIIDHLTIEKSLSENWKHRVEAMEEIKLSINQISDMRNILNHMTDFLQLLSEFLDDSSLKVVMSTLDIFEGLVERLRDDMRPFLRLIVIIVTKHLGDSKSIIREKTARILHRLMHYNPPIVVLNNMFECKHQRNPRLREELLNRVTAAVLTFPSYNFEFSYLCEMVAPFLVDTKRRVRLAALECFAVLAQAMGTSRIVYLVSAVDAVELNYDSDGLMAAVQARLARRMLPRCSPHGSVLHALTLPSSAGGQNCFLSHSGADVDWIMLASGPLSGSTPSRHRRIATSLPDINNSSWQNTKKDVNKRLPNTPGRKQHLNELTDKSNEISDGFIYLENSHISRYMLEKQEYGQEKMEENELQLPWHSPYNHRTTNKYRAAEKVTDNSKLARPAFITPVSPKTTPPSTASSCDTNSTDKEILDTSTSTMNPEIKDEEQTQSSGILITNEELPTKTTGWEISEDTHSEKKVSPKPEASPEDKLILDDSPSPVDNQSTSATSIDDISEPNTPDKMGSKGSHLFHSSGNTVAVAENSMELQKKDEIKVEMIEPIENIIKISPPNNQTTWVVNDVPDTILKEAIAAELWQESSEILPEVYGDKSNISISKITRDRLLKRQQEIIKEAEERKAVREKSRKERKQILEQRLLDERERQQRLQETQQSNEIFHGTNDMEKETLLKSEEVTEEITEDEKDDILFEGKTVNSSDSANSDISLNSSSASQITVASKKKLEVPTTPGSSSTGPSNTSQKFSSSSSLALLDNKHSHFTPYPNPDEALKKALRCLGSDTWTMKIEGMQMVSRLANCHPNVLKGQLHAINIALLAEVKSLRSSVSRTSILTLGELFLRLKRNMEADLETIVQTLLHKTGESVGFIRDDIDKIMTYMIEEVSANKAILAIMLGGCSHRNGAVRKTTAQLTSLLVERIGAAKCLCGQKEVAERLLPAAAQFVMDGVPLTRYHGRKIFQMLLPHSAFDKMLSKYVHPTTIRNIRGILESIRKKGIGEIPRERISARVHKVGSRSAMPSRTVP